MKYLILTVFSLVFFLPGLAFAQVAVDFESTPLFAGANLLPGDVFSRTVTVTNNGVETETVQFDFTEIVSGELANVTELAVSDNDSVYVFDTFINLFSAGPHPLGTLAAGASQTYTFTAAIPTAVGNTSQNSQFSFDLLIGFAGAAPVSDTGGSGGGGGTQTLQLFNEIAIEDDAISGAFLAWNSNRAATTYLICGAADNGPFALSETGPLFGYEFALAEEDLDTTEHGVAVSDLAPGEYECRPAGREEVDDGFTVGDPVQFTVALQGQVAGESISLSEADIQELLQGVIDTQLGTSVIGNTGKGTGGMTYEEFTAELADRSEAVLSDIVNSTTSTMSAADSPENETSVTDSVLVGDAAKEPLVPRTVWLWVGVISLLLLIITRWFYRKH